jgi:hypothetical protein
MSTNPTTTAPDADLLPGLAALFIDLEADNLRELVADAEPTALNSVLADLLAVIAWRCDLGRRLAGDTGIPRATTNERLVRASTAARLGL